MNRTDRLSAILIMLQTKKLITAAEVAERFEISVRTVYRDIRALEEGGIPLGAEPGKGYYLIEGYHLPPVMFTAEEAGSIIIAGKLADSFSDTSVKQHVNLAIDKIKSVLPESHKDFIDQMEDHVRIFHKPLTNTVDFANNYITTIQKAISEKKCLEMSYYSKYNDTSTSRLVEPLGLCFYGFQWHLIAYCRLRNSYRDFRVDRIQKLCITEQKTSQNQNMSVDKYFSEIFYHEGLFSVSVKFDNKRTGIIANTRYYYGYFEELLSGEITEMKFAVNDYTYLANWLITLGEMVIEIPSPELKDEVQKLVKQLCSHYLKI